MESLATTAPRRATPRLGDHRCVCHRLLGRTTANGLELKCPRCRRIVELAPEGMEGEVRCECGRLLARRGGSGLELRCPRCKREHHLDAAQRWTLGEEAR